MIYIFLFLICKRLYVKSPARKEGSKTQTSTKCGLLRVSLIAVLDIYCSALPCGGHAQIQSSSPPALLLCRRDRPWRESFLHHGTKSQEMTLIYKDYCLEMDVVLLNGLMGPEMSFLSMEDCLEMCDLHHGTSTLISDIIFTAFSSRMARLLAPGMTFCGSERIRNSARGKKDVLVDKNSVVVLEG